jgi:hypothetical protein
VTLTVTLSGPTASTVTISYSTANGTATAGSDYTAKSGTLTFAPGTTTQTISITIAGDRTRESNETFVVNLTGPTNATVAPSGGTATVTIVNDDGTAATAPAFASTTITDSSSTIALAPTQTIASSPTGLLAPTAVESIGAADRQRKYDF